MSRRTRPGLAASAAVLALTAVPLAVAPAAQAAATPKPASAMAAAMPPIGAELPSSMLALQSELRIGQEVYTVDFRSGIRQRVEADPEDPFNSVRLRTVGFRATAELPDGGTVVLEQAGADVAAESTLTRTQQSPPRYTERDAIPVNLTIDRPGQAETVTLEGSQPMVLRSTTLTHFPARGDTYTLQAPLNLTVPDDPDTVVATLQTFTAERGGL